MEEDESLEVFERLQSSERADEQAVGACFDVTAGRVLVRFAERFFDLLERDAVAPQLIGIEKTAQLPYASSLCGACREVCPVKIDIPRLLLHLRGEISARQGSGRRGERILFRMWAGIMTRPWLYEKTALAGRLFQRWFNPPLKAWTNGRDLRPIEAESFRDKWRRTR